MDAIHTLFHGGIALIAISVAAAWLSGKEPEPDGFFALAWRIIAAALSVSATLTLGMVPVAWRFEHHVQITETHAVLFAVLLVASFLWAMARMILLKLELA